MPDKKPPGKCPFCHEVVRAVVTEENVVRRDMCKCPECGKSILVCRTPGCKDYAEGGEMYDEELCPDCTSGLFKVVGGLATTAGGVIVAKKTEGYVGKKRR